MSVGAPDPNESLTPEQPPAPDPIVTPPAPADPAVVEPSGPWAKDLEATFADPATRGQVDAFLRGHVQPHVTKLETRASELQSAEALLNDLRQDPGTTFLALGRELYGDETVQELQRALGVVPEEELEDVVPEQPSAELDPRLQALIEKEEREAYNQKVAELGVIPDIFHPLVTAYGDIDEAAAAYPAHLERVKELLGLPTAEEVPEPPPVLDGTVQTQPQPHQIEAPKTLDDAFDQLFASTAPQTVTT